MKRSEHLIIVNKFECRDLESFKGVLDTSNYDKDHRLFSEQNRFEPGTFKDELPPNKDSGVPYEFVGLKSKMYCITNTQNQNMKKAKGVSKHIVRDFNNADYLSAIIDEKNIQRYVSTIRSYDHTLYTQEVNRKCLNCYDDKRFVKEDGVTTLCYGEEGTIPEEEEEEAID